jgi:hypothetical protein
MPELGVAKLPVVPTIASGGWRQTLAREPEAAEYEIDWNRVMRP